MKGISAPAVSAPNFPLWCLLRASLLARETLGRANKQTNRVWGVLGSGVSASPGGFCHVPARDGEDGSGELATEQRGSAKGNQAEFVLKKHQGKNMD